MLNVKQNKFKKSAVAYSSIALTTVILSLSSLLFLNCRASLPTHDSQGMVIPSLAPMLDKITDAVVNISTLSKISSQRTYQQQDLYNDPFFRRFFSQQPPLKYSEPAHKQQNLGSGVIINAKSGYILTNHHVIADADSISVTLKDGRKFTAELIGTDAKTDISLLKIPSEKLTEISLSDSDILRVGDFAVAIGNPYGIGQTVTSGIISALGRNNLGIEGYEDFIQTDASINPGNSGGALVNLNGELIGINTAILSKSGGNVGIGFAIPINMIKSVMDQLIKHGKVTRGILGVHIQDLTAELASALGINKTSGAIIAQVVANSAAERAGLKNGDIITKSKNKQVKNAADLRNSIGLTRPGETVKLELIRGNKNITVIAKIGGEADEKALSGNSFDAEKLHVGLTGASLGKNLSQTGIVVTEVKKGSDAWNTGLRAGDRIISINRYAMNSISDIKQFSEQNQHRIAINILRGNTGLFLVLE
ncbi:MAG: DegQ family serine endoprotease [Pseudomonadota bacterium]